MLPWFDLENTTAYRQWRDEKRDKAARNFKELECRLGALQEAKQSKDESAVLQKVLRQNNAVLYRLPAEQSADDDRAVKTQLLELAKRLGLVRLDHNLESEQGISTIAVSEQSKQAYIPYTPRPLSWHTDGYYNTAARQINTFMLHCVRPAQQGGATALLDHELLYCHLRDIEPRYIDALREPDAMSIPANIQSGKQLRTHQTGPVLSFLPSGQLHMRYSARSRNIEWKDSAVLQEACSAITEFLDSDSPFILRSTLRAGQGLICNNVLHNRSAFSDETPVMIGEVVGKARLLYRLRFYDRASNQG